MKEWTIALLAALALGACATPPEPSIQLTPADRAKLHEWAPAFQVLCKAEQLRECR